MPRYVLLIIDDPNREWATPDAAGQSLAKMGQFAGELAKQGKIQGGSPLKGMAEAVRVQARGGALQVTDGPFPETKEMIAGFFVIEAADRDEALAIAKRCPHAEIGPVELREVMEVGPPS